MTDAQCIEFAHDIYKFTPEAVSGLSRVAGARVSVLQRAHQSKLPTQEQLARLPIAAKPVQPVNLSKVKSFMHDDGARRFGELLDLLQNPRIEPCSDVHVSAGVPAQHCQFLAEQDIIERASPDVPTKGGGTAFFVVETKADPETRALSDRLRFIFWPKRHNDWLRRTYRCDVPLRHVSFYLDAVRDECGATADFTSGFYQVELPPSARAWFRFKDATGALWQMSRLPMGLSISVEIMQMISEVVAGDVRVCARKFVIPRVRRAVWIDDMQITGAPSDVRDAILAIDRRRQLIGATFKSAMRSETRYEFIGVSFDHAEHSVSVGAKTLVKLPQSVPDVMTGADIQALTSRLIWCDGVLRIPLAAHHFAIKFGSRMMNRVNRGSEELAQQHAVWPVARTQFNAWIAAARGKRQLLPRSDEAVGPALVIHCDASLQGWGAILCDPLHRIFIAGGRWDGDEFESLTAANLQSGDIGRLEGRAFTCSCRAFREFILQHRSVRWRIDNTSVTSAIQRGKARADALSRTIAPTLVWLVDNDVKTWVEYIESERNAADFISRGMPLTREEVSKILN